MRYILVDSWSFGQGDTHEPFELFGTLDELKAMLVERAADILPDYGMEVIERWQDGLTVFPVGEEIEVTVAQTISVTFGDIMPTPPSRPSNVVPLREEFDEDGAAYRYGDGRSNY